MGKRSPLSEAFDAQWTSTGENSRWPGSTFRWGCSLNLRAPVSPRTPGKPGAGVLGVMSKRERTAAERIADQEAWYYGAPERNRPNPCPHCNRRSACGCYDPALARGAAFVAGLPEGTVIELRTVEPPMRGRPGGEYATFPVRRARVVGTVKDRGVLDRARLRR
jgi:hypothetical protein